MKIAVPTKENNQIDSHFGHCEFYTVYQVSDNKEIIGESIVKSPVGCGCKSNIASELSAMGVKVMLAGGIGEGAINKLASHNIQVVRNCQGEVRSAAEAFLAGTLQDGGSSCSSHSHACSH